MFPQFRRKFLERGGAPLRKPAFIFSCDPILGWEHRVEISTKKIRFFRQTKPFLGFWVSCARWLCPLRRADMRSCSDIKHHAGLLGDWFPLINFCLFFQWISLSTPLTNLIFNDARVKEQNMLKLIQHGHPHEPLPRGHHMGLWTLTRVSEPTCEPIRCHVSNKYRGTSTPNGGTVVHPQWGGQHDQSNQVITRN